MYYWLITVCDKLRGVLCELHTEILNIANTKFRFSTNMTWQNCLACGYDRAGQVQGVHVDVYQYARHHIAILPRPLQTHSSKIRFSNVSHLKPITAADGHYSDHCPTVNGLRLSGRTLAAGCSNHTVICSAQRAFWRPI
jgi:hypothetical protein